MKLMQTVLLTIALLSPTNLASAAEPIFDVVVYSATPAGVCAAVAAGRAKKSVALVEPMDLVGGIMASGLGFSDSNQTDRRTLMGLFDEFHLRVRDHYRASGVQLDYDPAVKDNSKWTYEPKVAEAVFRKMLAEAGVKLFLQQTIYSAKKSAVTIESITTNAGEIRGKTFIDASYEGDLLAVAKVGYVVGREGKSKYGERLAGHQFPKKKVDLSPLKNDQLLPHMTGKDGGADDGDEKIMTYSFRLILTQEPGNRVPFAMPENYDPAEFELARRLFQLPKPFHPRIDFYPIPGNKVDANNSIGGQFSLGLVGASWKYPDASYAEREKIWQLHKDYTLRFIWFLANDPAVPEATRVEMSAYGLAKDEFTATQNWPPVLYIREARRMLGEYVVTEDDILRDVSKPDAIAIGSFPIDSHDCQRIATADGGWINEGTIFPVHMKGAKYGQPHQLPYRSILPRASECNNLLVPVCLSASHVAISSIRVEPTWMALGQSAGIAAAMAAEKNLAVQELPIPELQSRLRAAGQVLDLFPEHLAAAKASP